MESAPFFAAQKSEPVNRTVFPSLTRARQAIAEHTEVFTNRTRLHSGLGYKTPLEVTTENQQHQLIAA